MATTTCSNSCNNSTVAQYKAWVTDFFAAFDTLGLPQTADLGQVVPASIAAVPSAWQNYQIRRFDDTLQGTYPIIMKIEVCGGTTPGVRLTVGTASDGNGNISGANKGVAAGQGTAALGSGVPYTSYFSGGSNGFTSVLWGGEKFIWFCERGKDNNGNDIGDYAVYGVLQSTSIKWIQVIHPSLAPPAAETRLTCDVSVNIGLWNGEVPTQAIRPVMGHERNPIMSLLVGRYSDWTDLEEANMIIYGGLHNYKAFSASTAARGLGTVSGSAALLRWE